MCRWPRENGGEKRLWVREQEEVSRNCVLYEQRGVQRLDSALFLCKLPNFNWKLVIAIQGIEHGELYRSPTRL